MWRSGFPAICIVLLLTALEGCAATGNACSYCLDSDQSRRSAANERREGAATPPAAVSVGGVAPAAAAYVRHQTPLYDRRHGELGPTTETAIAAAAKTAGGIYKVGKPYQIKGVWYTPGEDYDYDETGIASWYGPGFHGKKTANGEVYDQMALTAAHRTLPMPSLVRVTNLENGRSLVVRINDRGPFAHNRIIDLSKRGAQLLGFHEKGTTRVRVTVLADESRRLAAAMQGGLPPPAMPQPPPVVVASAPLTDSALDVPVAAETPAAPTPLPVPVVRGVPTEAPAPLERQAVTQYTVDASDALMYVQAGSFQRYDNAYRLGSKLARLGPTSIARTQIDGSEFFRVQIGPLGSIEEADSILERVIADGHHQARLVIRSGKIAEE